jgi:hypothetical protein
MTDITPETTTETPEPQAPAELTVEQREDAYLMEIDGEDPDEQSAPEPATTQQTPVEEDEAAPEQEREEESDTDTGSLEEAWGVLRRDGFSKDDLAALSDEAISRLAAHRKKVQTDVDRMLSEAKAKPEAEEQSREVAEEPTTAEATQSNNLSDNLFQAAKVFADHVGLDDEGAKLLAQSYESLVGPMQKQIEMMQTYMGQHQIETSRARLAEKYPQVADASSEEYGRVIQRMNKLQANGEHTSVQALMEDAIAFEFRDQLRQEAESAKSTLRNFRNNGVSSKPNGTQPESPALSAEEIEDQVLALLESDAPDKVERARRLTGR